MTDINAKALKEKTARTLDRVQAGESFRVTRNGTVAALLVPPRAGADPEWKEIMSAVWEAQKQVAPTRPNPVLAERRRRNRAARLR